MAKPLGGGDIEIQIYTIFDPVMHTTIALDEFEDELPWPTFDLLF